MPHDTASIPGLRTIVTLACTGDTNAFGELVRRFQDMAIATAYGMTGDYQTAEDIAQEAFVNAWEKRMQLRDPNAFPGWFRRIVVKHGDRYLRRRKEPVVPLGRAGLVEDTEHDDETLYIRLDHAIAQLPEQERRLVRLFYSHDQSLKAVSEYLDIPVSTVKNRLFKARRRLKERMFTMAEDKLKARKPSKNDAFVDGVMRIIRPKELERDEPTWSWSCRGSDMWDMLCAALTGDVKKINKLVKKDPNLVRAEYWYTQPLHFAVREGHLAAVQALLDAGADPTFVKHNAPDLVTVARDRGHDAVAALLEKTLIEQRGASAEPHEIHRAAGDGDLDRVRALLDRDASLAQRGDPEGRTPLHYAVREGHFAVANELLDRGADVDAAHAKGNTFYASAGHRPISLAMDIRTPAIRWAMMGLLLGRGAAYTITVAARLGDIRRVQELLAKDKKLANHQESNGARPIGAAARENHMEIVKLLLDHGADPALDEGRDAPRGIALWWASQQNNYDLARLLVERGGDPNGFIESGGSPMTQAKTEEMRALMYRHGGVMSVHDYIASGGYWTLDAVAAATTMGAPDDEELAGMFTHIVSSRNRDLLHLMLARGLRVPPVVTGCQEYLWHHTDMTRVLLEHGMDPNLPNWQRMTPLHHIAGRTWHNKTTEEWIELVDLFLEFGADIDAIDEEFRSTPLGWASRQGKAEMAVYLLDKGADPNGADAPWATPLAWAEKRGHMDIARLLKKRGAKA